MDIADDVVDILAVDDNLRVSALDKLVLQLFDGAFVNVDSLNLRSRHHTVAHLCIGKVQRVMEDFHLFLYLVVLGIVDA